MDKDEEMLRNSKGYKDAVQAGMEAVDMATLLARQKAINDAHDKIVDLSPDEWTENRPLDIPSQITPNQAGS